jgi:Mg-chelatase subunit ChlD
VIGAVVVALFLASNALAADPVAMTVSGVEERIGGMTAYFTVTDDTGQESTLTPELMQASLDGKALRVTGIEKTSYGRQPASIVLMVDVSGSMYGAPIEQARAAVREFIGQVEPDDRIALMSFSTGVTLLQDFTSDRSLLDAAVGGITAFGDTALFDAVNAAIAHSNTAPAGGKLIVLLSDGVASHGLENRAASLTAAEQAGTSIIAVGLGPSVDVDYLRVLTGSTGGRYVNAASAAQLRATYGEIAKGVTRRYFSDYRLEIEVPPNIDRTVDGTLLVEADVRGAALSSQLPLGPLAGAVPPPYTVGITGLTGGSTLKQTAAAGVIAPAGREIASIEFLLDGKVVGSAAGAVATHSLDPAAFATGTHTFAVRTVDVKGGAGYGEVSFLVLAIPAAPPPQPEESSSLPVLPVLMLLGAGAVGYLLFRVVRSRLDRAPEFVTKSLGPSPAERLEIDQASGETADRPARVRASQGQQANRIRGRVVVMRESAIIAGDLHTTREYDLGDAPMTIGTGKHVDIVLDDDTGLIGEEEARLWVQRGRITFHRLTALSAMATAGVTPGWEFFDDGDELRVGAYRFVFKVEVSESRPQVEEQITGTAQPQEHGMTLRPSEPFGWDNR